MKALRGLNRESERLLKMPLSDIESPRHLYLAEFVPVIDIVKLEAKLTKRHPELAREGISMADIIEDKYGAEAVAFVEKYALGTNENN